MNRLLKILLIIFAAIIIIIVAGFIIIKSYLTPSTVHTIAEKIASEAIKRPIDIGKVGVAFGFKIGITVDDIAIANTRGFSSNPLVRIDRATLNLKLLPLLRRQIVISSIDLKHIEVNVERNAQGDLNFVALAPREGKGSEWSLSLSSLSISDGEITYADARELMEIRVKDINQRIAFKGNTIGSSGNSTVYLLKHKKLPEMVVRFDVDCAYDTLKKDLQIKKLTALYEPIVLEISGSVEHMENLNLKSSVRIDDMSGLKPLIPSESRPVELNGKAHANITVLGNIKEPAFDGHCELKDVGVVPKGMNRGVSKLNGSLSFDRDAVRNIILQGHIGRAQLTVRGSLEQLRDPVLNITTQVTGDLQEFEQLTSDMQNIKMKGQFSANLAVKGKIKKPSCSGEYSVENATIDGLGFAQPMTQLVLKGTIQDNAARIAQCTFKVGRSDFNINGIISKFSPLVLELHDRSSLIDLDEMLPKPQKGKKTEAQGAPVKASGTVQAVTLNGYDMVLKNVNTSFVYENGIIDIENCDAHAFDGKVIFDFYYNANNPEPYRINTHMQSVSAKKMLIRFLKFENIEGKLSGMSNFTGNGLTQREVVSNISASGNLKLNNGTFNNFTFITTLLNWLGVKDQKTIPIENLVLYFKISKGRMQVNDWALTSSIGNILVGGTIGLDGRVDLNIATTLNKKYSDIVKKYHGDWIFPIDNQGRATIDILAKGTLSSPQFSLDKNKIKDRIKGKVKDEFDKKKKEWEQKLKGLLKG